MEIRGIIFDLDGTLLDTLEDISDSANECLKNIGLEPLPLEVYREIIGDGVRELFKRALFYSNLSSSDNLIESLVNMMQEEYGKRWNKKTKLYEGIAELLDWCSVNGLKMAILSNKQDMFTQRIVDFFLSKWDFVEVKGITDVNFKKPNPKFALDIAKKMKILPENIAFVGDSKTDIQTALFANMIPIGVLWGFKSREELEKSGAKIILSKPREMINLISGNNLSPEFF